VITAEMLQAAEDAIAEVDGSFSLAEDLVAVLAAVEPLIRAHEARAIAEWMDVQARMLFRRHSYAQASIVRRIGARILIGTAP
jgi:hypothetical protein